MRFALTLALLAGCDTYNDLGNTGMVCVQNEGDAFDPYGWYTTGTPTGDVLVPGPSTLHVVLDSCHSSSVSNESATCAVAIDGSTLEVTSEGGYDPPRGAQNDDCNMLVATCAGPELVEGDYTLTYGGDTLTFTVPATETPCLGDAD